MNKFSLLVYCALFSAISLACSKKSSPQPDNKLRVLGYLMSDNNWHTDMNGIDFTKITDLNLAFINPDASGQFSVNDNIKQVITKAHGLQVRVFMSIGGGSPPAHLAGLITPEKRAQLIGGIVALVEKYNFDGVDVDLENDLINEHYADFVNALGTALQAKNKLMTAALASWNAGKITDATLGWYDFINIMSYDKTGPWNTANPGPHAPYEMATADFDYFHKTRKIAAEKLLIGLPFYGYGFGTNAPESIHYKDLIVQYPGAENADEITVNGGGKIYYNGIGTIRQKVKFALAGKAGGVMIWELKQDSRDGKSLLGTIHAAIKE